MALPTLQKTWQFNVNNQIVPLGTTLLDNQTLLLAIKNAMLGFATNPCTMVYSCNSTTAGTAGDGVDRITTATDLVWANAGTAHSWFVIKQTGLASNFQILFSCEGASSSGTLLTVVYSQSAGFTGGTTTARPTATDQVVLLNGAQWNFTNAPTEYPTRWSVMQSTDGQCLRVLIGQQNNPYSAWFFETLQNPTTGLSPAVVCYVGGGAIQNTFSLLLSVSNFSFRYSGATYKGVMSCEGYAAIIVPTDTAGPYSVANEIDAGWPMAPLGFVGTTAGARGHHGSFYDLWVGSSTAVSLDTYPSTGTNLFLQAGVLIYPWDGSTPAFS